MTRHRSLIEDVERQGRSSSCRLPTESGLRWQHILNGTAPHFWGKSPGSSGYPETLFSNVSLRMFGRIQLLFFSFVKCCFHFHILRIFFFISRFSFFSLSSRNWESLQRNAPTGSWPKALLMDTKIGILSTEEERS